MGIADQNSATWNDFLEQNHSQSELSYSLGTCSALEADDILLETAEIMAHGRDFFLHNGPALRLGLI